MATARIVELTDSNTCKLCDNSLGKYTCPRCNILYCSLLCYQSQRHMQCSENFYKDHVIEHMHLNKNEDSSEKKIQEILQRTYDNSKLPEDTDPGELDSDDEEYEDIAERLIGIDLDDSEQVWSKLNADERQEFEAFLRSGDVTKLLPKWKPWWSFQSDKKVEDVETLEEHKTSCPTIYKEIQDFSSISKKQPADCTQFNIINILAAYAFTVRFFNGEHCSFAKEAVSYVTNLSLNIKNNVNFEEYATAVDSIQQECFSCEWILADEENIRLMKEDLGRIVSGPHITEKNFYVLCALSDLHKLLKASLKNTKKDKDSFSKQFPESQFPTVNFVTKENVKLHMKKVEFYLAFAKDFL